MEDEESWMVLFTIITSITPRNSGINASKVGLGGSSNKVAYFTPVTSRGSRGNVQF